MNKQMVWELSHLSKLRMDTCHTIYFKGYIAFKQAQRQMVDSKSTDGMYESGFLWWERLNAPDNSELGT